jgi:YVTN family beta-propeller protein
LLRASGWLVLLALAVPATAGAGSFVTFESGQVRPLALSPDGGRLFAVNTPDNRLEIFAVDAEGLTPRGSVPVGLEPVAVAARTNGEVWVVNHLSDSVSVVDVAADPPRVVRTLLVGDEPRDIVFAGPGRTRAFITTAHRGQNSPIDPQFTTPGVGRADVWVFDALALGSSLGGDPLNIVTLFGDTPRALAASPDGRTVYAAVFHSGNQTTSVVHANICDGGVDDPCIIEGREMPGGLPGPTTNVDGVPHPKTSLIVRYNDAHKAWEDELGRRWNNAVRFTLPDLDVFVIDATANPPVEVRAVPHVGTVIFNLAVNPVSGKLYASNTEAHNEVRFSGAGIFGGSTVRGHLHESRITVIDGKRVTPRHLNTHIDYATVPSPAGVKEKSLSIPTGMAVSRDGKRLYVAALGSSAIGVFDTAALESNRFVPSASDHIAVTGGGPTGLVLDEARQRLYVLTRFDDGIAVIDTAADRETGHVSLFNPEPADVVRGRPLLYDATASSSNGEAACASCHVFADFDSLAWDLGDPDASTVPNPNPLRESDLPAGPDFHPMKGPMTTQTLRGIAHQGPMHWRGDRTGGLVGGDPFDDHAALRQFGPAFVDLLGATAPASDAEMDVLAGFLLQIIPPPNPVRSLDGTLTPAQEASKAFFNSGNCNACHIIDPAHGMYGTDGLTAANDGATQFMKVPRLTEVYQKVGLNVVPAPFDGGDTSFLGDQVRGFGLFNDGVFGVPPSDTGLAAMDYLLAMDTELAPIVGQQVTLTPQTAAAVAPRLDLLMARAAAGDCDLTVKGVVGAEARGWYRTAAGTLQSDRAAEPAVSESALRGAALADGRALTYTCVPPGSGVRIGVDRDDDHFFDGDERDAGTDAADPGSALPACAGDCNRNGSVTVDELIRAVNVAGAFAPLDLCFAADSSADGIVKINELLLAVRRSLDGCGS